MTTRGPVIIALEVLTVITALLAITALAVAVTTFEDRISEIQDARQHAAYDTCGLLQLLILDSGRISHHQARAKAFLHQVGLSNCHAYALKVRNGT